MADAGIDDILLTFNLLGRAKLHRLVALARRVRLSVTLDNAVVASELDAAMREAGLVLPVLIECDTGAERCGVQTPDEAVELARLVAGLEGPAPRRPDDLPGPRPGPGHRRLARRGRGRAARRRHRARRGQHRRHARPVPRARGRRPPPSTGPAPTSTATATRRAQPATSTTARCACWPPWSRARPTAAPSSTPARRPSPPTPSASTASA